MMSEIQRGALPVADIEPVGVVTYDARDPDTAFPPIEPLRPPAGAPNVLVVLLDDVGFGASSAFGGPVKHAHGRAAGAEGLKYTRFHTTALCSPTRAALLSGPEPPHGRDGRDHRDRDVGAGLQLGAPEHVRAAGRDPQANGYNTAQFGKCHEVPVWESRPAGPFDHWPAPPGSSGSTGSSAARRTSRTRRWYEGTSAVERRAHAEQGYHLMEDLADRGIAWVRQQGLSDEVCVVVVTDSALVAGKDTSDDQDHL